MIVGVWVEHPFQLYSAKPIVEKYKKRGDRVLLLTIIKDVDLCKKYLSLEDNQIININKFRKKWHSYAKLLFELSCVPENFSIVYYEDYVKNEKRLYSIIRKIFFLKLNKENVNRYFIFYRNLLSKIGFTSSIPLSLDLLISFTKVNFPFLIPYNVSHISIMESWDHPMKFPYYINPDFNMTWNKDLKEDTKFFQNIKRVFPILPLKFRYIYDRLKRNNIEIQQEITNKIFKTELDELLEKDIVLYPTTTSSIGIYHEGEMDLIDDLCNAIQGTGKTLYIKPKPNGPQGDYDIFKKYPNVIVGLYASNPDSRDMLDEEYHSFRYLLIQYSWCVINAGTTFALEAALVDKNILQLDLQTDKFGGFTDFSKTFHLEKYILENDYTFKYNGDINTLRSAIKSIHPDFKDLVKKWITNW